ncbi:MAG: fibronectin type III domain-containing protein [Solirubrobacteraceae bacterium]
MSVGARRSLSAGVVSLCAVLGLLLVLSASALAAGPPETPVNETVKEITATSATVEGELNPGKGGEVGEYFVGWRLEGSTRCNASYQTTFPEPPEVALGFKEEHVKVKVTGFEADQTITLCLVERNAQGEEAVGAPVEFKTLAAPPTVVSEGVSSPKAKEATLEAVLDPNGEETKYSFEYATKATGEKLEGTIVTIPGKAPIPSYHGADVGVNVSTGAVLAAGTTYYYRVLAENEQSKKEGKPADGKVESFTTAIPPEAPAGEEAKPVTGSTATLHGVLNPNREGNPGSYEFRYRQSGTECEGGQSGEEKSTPSVEATGHSPEPVEAEVAGLLPATTYTFCLQATNAAGETTLGAPATIVDGAVRRVLQLSEDGSYVYFLSSEVLTGAGGEPLRNGLGSEPLAGEENLYLCPAAKRKKAAKRRKAKHAKRSRSAGV